MLRVSSRADGLGNTLVVSPNEKPSSMELTALVYWLRHPSTERFPYRIQEIIFDSLQHVFIPYTSLWRKG